MKKMETLEASDEDESCRSSVISDLEEVEANLYSYVHHERNLGFGEEYATSYSVSSLEGVSLLSEILGESDGSYCSSTTSGRQDLPEAKEISSRSSDVIQLSDLADSACYVARNESDITCSDQSSGVTVPVLSPGKKAKAACGNSIQSLDTSPPVLEVSSSDEGLTPAERSLSKYGKPAASTPVKEYVVIDDSEEEVQIEYEKVPVKSKKKKKKRKLVEIRTDIQLNTRNSSEIICLDEDNAFSEKENIDSLRDQEYDNSEHERSLCKSWTPQMVHFYDESWGGEFINVSELQRTMSDDGWKVDVSDEFFSLTAKYQNRRYFGMKSKAWCTRCNQKGHFRNNCTEKIDPPRCHRCGSSKHQEYSCNQKICLTCGRFRSSMVAVCQQCRQLTRKKCYICQQPGHPPGCCPDLWRRFHATVVPGEIVTPQKVSYKDPKNTYCCNCASRGHHVFQCKKDNYSDYIPMNPKVASYVDPEVLIKFQSTCNHTTSNWERIGAVAPEYESEHGIKQDYLERGIKRPKSSSNKQSKSKLRKLEEVTVPKSVGTEVSSHKQGKISDKAAKKNEIMFTKLKVKKNVGSTKRLCKDKSTCSGNYGNRSTQNLKLEVAVQHNETSTMKRPEAKTGMEEKEKTNSDPNSGIVERMVVLSPGHLKRIESAEGKEILKYVTDRFPGFRAKVNPSGILKLTGTANYIDQVKADIFDILNNKYGLDQLKKSSNGNDTRDTKQHPRTYAVVVKHNGKKKKKKFHNVVSRYNGNEGLKERDKFPTSNSEYPQMAVGDQRHRVKKKFNTVPHSNCTSKINKGNKLNRKGKQPYQESAMWNEMDEHTRSNLSFGSVNNNLTSMRHVASSEGRQLSKCKEGVSETSHDLPQMNEGASQSGINWPRSIQPNVKFRINRNKGLKRNKKTGYRDGGKAQYRGFKQEEGRNGMHPMSNKAKKLQRKMTLGKDNLGLITVELGHSRKVSIAGEYSNDHSRIFKNQTCSRNGINTRYFQGASTKEYSSQV